MYVPVAVGINIAGGVIVQVLKLPLFLDTIGTYITAAIAGPAAAALAGALTNAALALIASPVYLPYAAVGVITGLLAGYMARAGLFGSIAGLVAVWIVTSVMSAGVAGVVTYFVFGGATGATGASFLTAAFIAATDRFAASVFSSAVITNLADRGITLIAVYGVTKRLPGSLLRKPNN